MDKFGEAQWKINGTQWELNEILNWMINSNIPNVIRGHNLL